MCPETSKLAVVAADDESSHSSVSSVHLTLGLLREEGLEPWPTVSTMILRLLLALNFFPSIQVAGKQFWFLSSSSVFFWGFRFILFHLFFRKKCFKIMHSLFGIFQKVQYFSSFISKWFILNFEELRTFGHLKCSFCYEMATCYWRNSLILRLEPAKYLNKHSLEWNQIYLTISW